MVMEPNSGQMVHATKECGKMIRQMVRENLYTLMVIFMRVSGSMIRLKELALTLTPTAPTTKVNGLMINSTVKELNPGLMVQDMKASMRMERKKVRVD